MSLSGFLTETATIYYPSFDAMDAYGNPQPGTETTADYPARLESLSSEELVRDRDTVVANWRVFLPADAVISPFDRIESDGKSFEVWGDPIERRTPRGIHHLEVLCRRVT
jgi:hypothetical protein